MQEEHLKLFIHEELYVVPNDPVRHHSHEQTIKQSTDDSSGSNQHMFSHAAAAEPEIISHAFIIVSDQLSTEESELLKKILAAVNVRFEETHHIVGKPQARLEYQKLIVFGNYEIEGVGNELYSIERTTQVSHL